MPSKGSGTSTNTVTQQSSPPQNILDNYQNVYGQAQNLTNNATANPGSIVAPLNNMQTGAIANTDTLASNYTPYNNLALGEYGQEGNTNAYDAFNSYAPTAADLYGTAAGINPLSNFNSYAPTAASDYASATTPLYSNVNNYLSPYIGDVVNATQNQFNNQNAIQQQGVIGNAVAQGAWGGDRSAVAQGIVAGQEQLNQAPVIAGLYNTGYGTALNAAETQGWLGTAAGQGAAGLASGSANAATAGAGIANAAAAGYGNLASGATGASGVQAGIEGNTAAGIGNLGLQNYNVNTGATGAQLTAGSTLQSEEQALLNAPYQQTGWLANIAEGLGGASGGTSSTQYPSPSAVSQAAGLGIGGLGILGATGAFGSSGYLTGALAGAGSGTLGATSGAALSDLFSSAGTELPNAIPELLGAAASPIGLRRGGRTGFADGGGISNDLSEAAGYGANGSGILSAAGGSGGILQDLSDPSSGAGAGLLTALSLRRGGGVRRYDGGGGIVPGSGPFGMPGESPLPVAVSVMALPQHGSSGNPIVGGAPRPPSAPPSSWGSTYANPNDYGGMLSGLARSIHSSGIMGQRRGGAVRRFADGGMASGIAPPSGAVNMPNVDPNTFVIDASPGASSAAPPTDPVATFWAQNGANPAAAQGISMAAHEESGGDPTAIGDDGTSFGTYQHHGPRAQALKDYAADQGTSWSDPDAQNQFALSEVHGGDPIATKHWDEIANAPDAGTGKALWKKYFERPGSPKASAAPSGGIAPPSSPAFMGQITDTGEPSMGFGPAMSGPGPQPSEMDNLKSAGADPWLALAAAGFGMASGTSPFAAANIGRGAEAGINFLETERQMAPEQRLRTAQAEQAEVTAGLTKAQLDYYANHGVNALNSNLAEAGKALTAPGARQIGATDGGASPNPTMMSLPNAGVSVPAGGAISPMTQQLDEYYRQLDFLAGAPMLPAQKAQIIEQIARLRDTDPRVAAAKAGMAAQAEVGPHIQEAGGKKAAELPSTITTTRNGVVYLGTQPIWAPPITRPYVTSPAEATPNDPAGTPHEGFRPQPMPVPLAGQPIPGGIPGAPGAISPGQPAPQAPPGASLAPQNPNQPIGGDWQTGLAPGVKGYAESSGKERGEVDQKTGEEVRAEAEGARAQQSTLNVLRENASNIYTGPGADYVGDFQKVARLLDPSYTDSVANRESLAKNGGQLVRQATRELSPRAAYQEVQFVQSTLPNQDMSPKGMGMVIGELQGLNDYKMAKATAQNQWETQRGGGADALQGFESAWQARPPVTPYTFIIQRMPQSDRQQLFAKWNQTQEGRAELQRLRGQWQAATQNGWAP